MLVAVLVAVLARHTCYCYTPQIRTKHSFCNMTRRNNCRTGGQDLNQGGKCGNNRLGRRCSIRRRSNPNRNQRRPDAHAQPRPTVAARTKHPPTSSPPGLLPRPRALGRLAPPRQRFGPRPQAQPPRQHRRRRRRQRCPAMATATPRCWRAARPPQSNVKSNDDPPSLGRCGHSC